MRRTLVAVPLMLVLALTAAGCGDDKDQKDDAGQSESTSTSESPSEGESSTSSSEPTHPVSEDDFCSDAKDAVTAGSADEALQRVSVVISNGLPEGMPQDAVDGIQVLIDIAPQLEKTSTAMTAFSELSNAERGDVMSLAGYLTTTCGQNLFGDLIPAMKDIPSELLSMLPSEMPTAMPS